MGIAIYKNIHEIARDNFNNILVEVGTDIQGWKSLGVSLQGGISTVEMNLLPRFDFFFSMLPLSPPPGYFREIGSMISKFIWSDGCPRVELAALQHPGSAGGLAVPNFELYCWSFRLEALHGWVDSRSAVSWRVIEADKVKPNRLQDILFTGTGKKGDNYKFGPVVANSIKIWKMVERRIGGPFKFCNSTPLWHNFSFVCGNRPFVQPSWSSLGVNTEHTCAVVCVVAGASVRFRRWGPDFVYRHLHVLFFFGCVLLSGRVAFLGLLPFPLVLCGTGLHHLLVGHLFP